MTEVVERSFLTTTTADTLVLHGGLPASVANLCPMTDTYNTEWLAWAPEGRHLAI